MKKRAANGQVIVLKESKPGRKPGRPAYTTAQKQAALLRVANEKSSCAQISRDMNLST